MIRGGLRLNLPSEIIVNKVGPRDGLQNETKLIPLEAKIEWINMLSATGASYIEVSSFVHPYWITQLKDETEVARNIKIHIDVMTTTLVQIMHTLKSVHYKHY